MNKAYRHIYKEGVGWVAVAENSSCRSKMSKKSISIQTSGSSVLLKFKQLSAVAVAALLAVSLQIPLLAADTNTTNVVYVDSDGNPSNVIVPKGTGEDTRYYTQEELDKLKNNQYTAQYVNLSGIPTGNDHSVTLKEENGKLFVIDGDKNIEIEKTDDPSGLIYREKGYHGSGYGGSSSLGIAGRDNKYLSIEEIKKDGVREIAKVTGKGDYYWVSGTAPKGDLQGGKVYMPVSTYASNLKTGKEFLASDAGKAFINKYKDKYTEEKLRQIIKKDKLYFINGGNGDGEPLFITDRGKFHQLDKFSDFKVDEEGEPKGANGSFGEAANGGGDIAFNKAVISDQYDFKLNQKLNQINPSTNDSMRLNLVGKNGDHNSPIRLGNVADAIKDDEAVNLSQLKKVINTGIGLQTNENEKTTVKLGDTIKITDGNFTKVSTITSQDGNHSFKIDIDKNKLLEGLSGTSADNPLVYTDKNGNKVYKQEDGSYSTTKDGIGGTTIDKGNIVVSLADSTGDTKNPIKLTNLGAGTIGENSTDAITGGQIHAANSSIATALGGGATVDTDGKITAPTYTLTNKDNSSVDKNSVGEALTVLDEVNKDQNTKIDKNIKDIAKNTTKITENSEAIEGFTDKDKGMFSVLAKDGIESKIIAGGKVQFNAGDENLKVTSTNDGNITYTLSDTLTDITSLTTKGNIVIDNSGIAMNNKKITNLGAGTIGENSTDAITGGQIHAANSSIATALGGGATVDTDGKITAPTYTLTNKDNSSVDKNSVGEALTVLDEVNKDQNTKIDKNIKDIAKNTTKITENSEAIEGFTDKDKGMFSVLAKDGIESKIIAGGKVQFNAGDENLKVTSTNDGNITYTLSDTLTDI
ncbi:hypothetical protein CRN67_06345, partial [Campylobacter blaseri]